MGRLVVDVACLAAVVLSGAHGQVFGHFSTAPQPTPSPKESMITRAVQQQLALQTGACASEWADHFSSQCPAGAFMALKGFKTTVGLVPVFRCEPTGCLHAPPGQGENIYNLRDEGTIMKDGVAREISMLMEEQPGVSFEKHLAARRKKFGKEGALVEGILSALLREASLGQPTATTLRFFAELAGYRGFAGAVVEEAWSYLEKYHREEYYHQGEAKKQAQIITRQEGTINNLQADLADARALLAEERAAAAALRVEVEAAEKTNSEIRGEADASVQEAQTESAGLRASLSAAVEAQAVSAKKAEGVAFELANVQTLLAEERNATVALRAEAKAAEGAITGHEAAILNVQAELSESKGEVTRLRSQLSQAVEAMEAAGRETANIRSEADITRQETQAKDNAKRQVIAQHEASLLNVQAELSESKGEATRLRSQLSEAVEATEAAERENANIRSEADITRRETQAKDNTKRQVIAQHEAFILNLQAELSDSKGEESWLHTQLSKAVEAMEAAERDNADIHSEADITRRETEMEQRKAKEDMDACTVRADACTSRADACTARADACTVRLRSTTDKFEAATGQMERMLSVSRSLQAEKNSCKQQLESLLSSNDQMEVPATADGGSDSTSGAPAP